MPLIVNQEIVLKGPSVEFLVRFGCICSPIDLLFNEESAPNYEDTEDGNKLINISKLNAMGTVINGYFLLAFFFFFLFPPQLMLMFQFREMPKICVSISSIQ
jgi:hypothetical protein